MEFCENPTWKMLRFCLLRKGVAQARVAQVSAVQAPVARVPAVQARVAQAPAVQAPVAQVPAAQARVVQVPAVPAINDFIMGGHPFPKLLQFR